IRGCVDLLPEVVFFVLFWTLLVRAAFLSRLDFSKDAIRRSVRLTWVGIGVEVVGAYAFLW
ncbi:hypothetical protein KIPB_017259, partial [Kipferlia bialata]